VDAVRRIADAVLYEGYVLWPYRKSAMKNQRRWTFGGVYPPGHAEVHPDDPSLMQAQCLLEGEGPDVQVRFLHVVQRQVFRDGEPVEELEAGGQRWVTWDEATERELRPGTIDVPAGSDREEVPGGAVERSWRPLRGAVELEETPVADGVRRIAVRVRNDSPWSGDDREDALRQTFCSTHVVLRAGAGGFVSLTDPPAELRAQADACENVGCWPVLVGEEGDGGTVLCSPIILGDYPEIAPESPGDLFDGGEIDQLLILNILSLTDEEKREMRDSDPRAREILERTEALSEDELMRLHAGRHS
jgi:hypothetical protein